MEYPPLEQVENADRYTICKWYRHLKPAETTKELLVMQRICKRYEDLGGFTPEISKSLGW